jgi:hypothetical protein
MTRPRTTRRACRRDRTAATGPAYVLFAVMLAACSVASAPGSAPTASPVAAAATPTAATPTAATPTAATPTAASSVAWLNVALVDEKLSISVPSEWTAKPTETSTDFVGPNGELVVVMAVPKAKYTMTSWTAEQRAYWYKEGKVSSDVPSAVGGAKSHRLILTTDINGDPFFAISEAFVHGDLAYGLDWMSPVGNEKSDTATFQRILDSVEFMN